MKISILILLLTACLTSQAIEIASRDVRLNLWEEATFLRDAEGKLDLKDVQEREFNPLPPNQLPNFGFTAATIWMRIPLRNPYEKRELILTFDSNFFTEISLHLVESSGNVHTAHTGLSKAFDPNVEIKYFGYALPVSLAANSESVLYLRARGKDPIVLTPRLFDRENFFSRLIVLERIFWFYFGVVIILLAYNFCVYYYSRESIFLYYILTLVAVHLFANLSVYFVLRIHLFPQWIWFQVHLTSIAHLFGPLSAYLFVSRFIDLPKHFPRINQTLKTTVWITLGLLVLDIWTDQPWTHLAFQIVTSSLALIYLIVGAWGARIGILQARLFLIAWGFLLAAWIVYFWFIYNLRVDPNILDATYGYQIILLGGVIEGALLSLALGVRLRTLRVERNRAEALAMTNEAKAELARQVAHDIRSPLTALELLINREKGPTEDERPLINRALGRIREIASDLLQAEAQLARESQCLQEICELLLCEKRSQYTDQPVSFELVPVSKTFDSLIEINGKEIRRVLSNLIDNSVESGASQIKLEIHKDFGGIRVDVRDDGRGIPASVLTKLGKERITHGKESRPDGSGNGLGVFHATRTVRAHGGDLHFSSEPGKGTIVSLHFKKRT